MKTRRRTFGWSLAVALGGLMSQACQPNLVDEPWLVRESKVVAVRAVPAEVLPGATVTLEGFALDPGAEADTSETTWSVCSQSKPPAESRTVDPACLQGPPAAVGNPVGLLIPADACAVNGPDVPQPAPGQPPARPRDPDATGGYFQPVIATWESATTVALVRILCHLPAASLAVAQEFRARYQVNENPIIEDLTLSAGGQPLALPWHLPSGTEARLDLQARGDSAETFPVFDPLGGALHDVQETLFVSWWATGGSVTFDPGDTWTVRWRAGSTPGPVWIVAVLRDSRGGFDVRKMVVLVE